MKVSSINSAIMLLLLCCAVVVTGALMGGCSGSNGAAGSTTGNISGTVTSATGATPIAGVAVTTSPSAGSTTTDSNGAYSLSLPAGAYSVTFSASYYTTGTATANVAVGISTPLNVSMAEADSGKPTITVAASGQNVGYGTVVNLTATASDPNGGALTYSWKATNSMTTRSISVVSSGLTATTTTPTLTTALSGSAAPSSDPGGYVKAYTQYNYLGVLPITSDTRGAISVTFTANDGQGKTNAASVTVYSAGFQPGMNTIAVGVPVYLNSGSTATTTTWTVVGPATSPTYSVSTSIGTGRNPFFTPDVIGKYLATASTATTTPLTLYAGKWVGVINGGSYTTKVVSGVTYTNWPVVSVDPGCTACHDGGTAPDKFTPWKATPHANFFATGLEGITSNSGTCTPCHLVGYDIAAAAANDGFDDMATLEGFSYAKSIGAWSAMTISYPQTARRANIQCENCHGPQNTVDGSNNAHTTTNSVPTSSLAYRISYKAEVCAQCHASGTGHHIYSEWKQSAHGNAGSLASKVTNATTGSCVRCHVAQGAVDHLDNILSSGNAGTVSISGYTAAQAEPITCAVCHDPHDATNEFQLRVVNDLPTTMGGFGVKGYGTGAICNMCHNVRNGLQCATAITSTNACLSGGKLSNTTFLHEDNDAYAMTLFDTPHDAAQAEIFAGRSAFFFSPSELPWLSKHQSVKNACAGCHMALNPESHLSHGAPAVSMHRFAIQPADADEVCANCHSSNVSAEGVTAAFESLLEETQDAFIPVLRDAILAGVTGTVVYTKTTSTLYFVPVATMNIKPTTEGRFYIYSNPSDSASSNYRANFYGLSSDGTSTNMLFSPTQLAGGTDQDIRVKLLRKATWNMYLADIDSSSGLHNPSFVFELLRRTRDQLLNYPPLP